MPFTAPDGSDPVLFAKRIAEASIPTTGDCLDAMLSEAARCLDRTARGVDFEERPFIDYSGKSRRSGPVTLRASGKMLDAMNAEAGGTRLPATLNPPALALEAYPEPCVTLSIGIDDPVQAIIAQVHNDGTGREPQRRFMDSSPSDLASIQEQIAARVERRLDLLPT